MVITVDQLKELPIAPPNLHIKQVIVDFKKIEVVAIVFGKARLFGKSRLVNFADIRVESSDKGIILPSSAMSTTDYMDQQRFGDLTDYSVFTERKRYLGKLVTYKVDTDSAKLTALWVKPPLALRDLWRQILLIGRSQIVQITPEAIIVDEAVIKSALKASTVAELGREAEAQALGAASPSALESNNPNG